MATNSKKSHINPYYAIAIIVGAVMLLAALFMTVQNNFSHKLKSIEITTSTGPVSPEYQQTQTIRIAKDSCSITTTKGTENNPVTTNCQSPSSNFADIQKSFVTYGVLDKITESRQGSTKLIGGSTINVTATLQNGDSYTTKGDANFQESIQPFLDQISLDYPEVGKF